MRILSASLTVLGILGFCGYVDSAFADGGAVVVEDFEGRAVPDEIEPTDAEVKVKKREGGEGRALRVDFQHATRPGIVLNAPEGTWDWSDYAGVAIEVTNPEEQPVELFMRVDSTLEGGRRASARGSMTIPAGETRVVPFFFTNHGAGPYWGMRGIPERGPVMMHGPGLSSITIEPGNVNAFRLYLNLPEKKHTLFVDNVCVFKAGNRLERLTPFPFVDRFGQYMHADWPGKVHGEADMQRQKQQEEAALAAAPQLAGRDAFGGWANGPQLDATGWFRAEKVNGKWWLVTPDGHLFFSLGMDCLYHGDATFIEGRDEWFEWVPESDGEFKEFLGHRSGVHSMGEPINGEGRTLNFQSLNLKRKYGPEWQKAFRETAYKRLPAWGFNTIGNWAAILDGSPIPFVVSGGSGGGRPVEASEGFWGRMTDVFDPGFAEGTEKNMARLAADFGDNPMVLGYFIDNEQSWKGIPRAVLASPVAQPARVVFIEDLKAKYGELDQVNEAWKTDAVTWDELRVPARPTDACKQDARAFEYRFGRKYFETVRDALKKHAPNQLYLGCRFTLMYCPEPVLKACAEIADVVSINAYLDEIKPDMFNELDKPVVIGEFHIGALDRGMFHQGLQSATDQADRAAKYVHYVKSVADNPCFVGCHWFQYADQPLTGRAMDGENYAIGFVSIVDTPYAEMVEAAKDVHGEVCDYRYSGG